MSTQTETHISESPVRFLTGESPGEQLRDATGLCLSGGGYRAMVFHIGSLWRLNEAAILGKLDRISTVSGGSITGGMLGLRWRELKFVDGRCPEDRFRSLFVDPIRSLAGRTIDEGAILGGIFLPGTISDRVAQAYDKHLFHGATLQDLPNDATKEGPRFVFNATSVQTGALWRFSRPYMGDHHVGLVGTPKVPLARAVAASSAFPPVLSPVVLEIEQPFTNIEKAKLHQEPYTTEVVLADGGVYDNLGLETVWKQFKHVLVSDAGGKMQPEPEPDRDWARHAMRILDIIDNQVRSLRKRQTIDAFEDPQEPHDGAYWGIRTDIRDYKLAETLPCPEQRTLELANTPTRLKRLEPTHQERLINWGYAVCDAAIRKHVKKDLPIGKFPYPVGV